MALLRREAELNEEELTQDDARVEANRILAQLADPNVPPLTKKQIKDRFSKIHVEWAKAYEKSERERAPRARRRVAPVGLLEQFQQSFTITGDVGDFVENDVVEEWLNSTNQTKNLQQLKNELRTHCRNQNPPIVIDTGAQLGHHTRGIKGIKKKIEVVVEPATIPRAEDYVGVSDSKLREMMQQNNIPCLRADEHDDYIAKLVEHGVAAPLEVSVTAEEANLTSKIRELNDIAERLLETGAVTVKGTKNPQRRETEAVFQFVVPAAQSQLVHCIRFLKEGDDLPTAHELKTYYEEKIDALDYLPDAEREQMKKCLRDASADLAPVTIVKRCAELKLDLCRGCQNIAVIRERREQGNVSKYDFEKPENLCANMKETQEALEPVIVLHRVHDAIADELKTYEKSVLQGMVDRSESLEDRLRPRARFFLDEQFQVFTEVGARADWRPAIRASVKARRKNNWTGRTSSAQGNNDPHSRRVRVLTDRMRSAVRIRDL